MMMNNNNQMTTQMMFPTQYEVQSNTTTNMISGLGAMPQMPGYTPVIMNLPFFPPQGDMNVPNLLNPIFLNPNQIPHTSPHVSPVLIPMQPQCFNPSMSPPQNMMPMLSLSPMPPLVSVSSPPNMSMSQSSPPAKNYLSAATADRSRSRSCSVASESDSGDFETRVRSYSRPEAPVEAPSKRALVDKTLGWMQTVFGERYDNDGTRGENVLRLKVKTVIALEHIIEFITLCHNEGLIHSISCPVSTKKGRQHVRGYLAYIKGFSGTSADRIEAIFEAYNREKGYPFKTLHRNPASTL